MQLSEVLSQDWGGRGQILDYPWLWVLQRGFAPGRHSMGAQG